MTNSIYFDEETLLQDNQGLIYGAVKAARINKEMSYFDDFVQEAQLEWLKLIRAQQRLTEPMDVEYFKAFSYNKIVWHLRDLRRKIIKEEEWLVKFEAHEGETLVDDPSIDPSDLLINNCRVDEFMKSLSPLEKEFVLKRFNEGVSMTQLAKEYGCSQKTVYQYRKKIQQKYRDYY
ncbi:sigma-70 family RNA polymerase sigma factor [uncultured Vagococcus sp.]|uniref:sigma-70 family RNA polymerase sigma factor n=1 Tax=uncultured Vagococcus sp. TaxID=189676 RepID=UPI0028D26D98|nr:sigma-70 family RNA polymerase sigma factor [uncultured Vagococcus sp.]